VRKRKRKELEIDLLNSALFKPIFFILIYGIILYFVINAFSKYLFLKKQAKILETQLEQIKQENKKLEEEIYLLQTDTDTIEYYIRKELNYKKPKEKVLIIK